MDLLEHDGAGLNLTYEVRMGILLHTTGVEQPDTLEGQIVRLSDKIAYFHHDMDDAIRGGILKESDLPESIGKVLGFTAAERLDHFIHDIITFSKDKNTIGMSEETAKGMQELRAFMFERVYNNPLAKSEEGKAMNLVVMLYHYYYEHFDRIPEELKALCDKGDPKEQVVCDFIAAMTDRFAIAKYEEIYIPKCWHG